MLIGWKTILFSIATTLLGALQTAGITNVVAQYPGYMVMGAGILSFFLRLITKTPAAIKVSVNPKPVVTPVPAPTTVFTPLTPVPPVA